MGGEALGLAHNLALLSAKFGGYLGAAGAKSYLAGSSKEASETNNLLLRLTPDTWRTVDYGKA